MGYVTGSFSGADNFESVYNTLKSFLTSEGWAVAGTYPAVLSASAGRCHVNLLFSTSATLNDSQGSTGLAASPDHRILGRLGVDATPITPSGSAATVSNDWTAPYAKYWLFGAAAGEDKYCHFVVQKANGRFCHLSFGNVDRKGVPYTGGAYLDALYWGWNFQALTNTGSTPSGEGSDITASSHGNLGDTGEAGGRSSYNVFVGDIDPVNPVMSNQSSGPTARLATLWNRTSMSLSGLPASLSRWLGWLFFVGPNPINGATPVFDTPLLKINSASNRSQYLGDIPGRRVYSMIGRNEAEVITYGADTYMVFPWKRALPWTPELEPWTLKTVTSGPYGYAFKVNA